MNQHKRFGSFEIFRLGKLGIKGKKSLLEIFEEGFFTKGG